MKNSAKWVLVAFFAVYLVIDVVFLLIWIERENQTKIASTMVRACIAGGLFIAVYRGKRWARNLWCIFLSLGLLVGVFATMAAANVVMLAFMAYMIAFLYILLLSKSVIRFLEEQRQKYD